MAYISKSNILAAYKKLSQMHPDPNAQGATQKISAIRHFLALDSFYKLHNRDCNTRDRNDKEEYANLVGKVCDVCLNWYTTNFYYPLKRHTGDYSVGSNFYSAGQVNASLVNPNEVFDYPKRGNIPLMNVQNGVLKRKVSLYRNLENYITSTDYAVALVVWLIRKISIEQNNDKNMYDNIHIALSEIFTIDLLNVLFKDPTAFEQELNKYNLAFNDNFYSIQKNDIDNLFDISSSNEEKHIDFPTSHQVIFYGAPGTGKSHRIKEKLEYISKENIFRTTFHPDSDYSTFVGAYKPTMEKPEEQLYNKDELISKLTEFKEQGVTYSPQKFAAKYWYSLKQLTPTVKRDILLACGMSDSYTVEIDKGVAIGEELLKVSKESRIVYRFVPQAFLNAYIRAYQTTDNVYLIIEEINRGNCAQIFGDLFQLIDRDENGVSEYTIKADADLRVFLEEKLGEDNLGIKEGELCLPSNLYIYATMNTSDQSLFPIDSAFKRRWDWEYEPIKYKNTDWKIVIADTEYSWVSFQRKVNDKILGATSSEDKMLGDYFVKPSDGVITDKILLNKILFYLWNDVCKDGEGDIFKISETEDVSFSELYGENGTKALIKMMSYLGVTDHNGNKVTIKSDEDIVENQSE
ncbi:MAG: hypothetical protein OSJ62_15920 [Lachnospiraceae bacterium]|nr:hypothetical protein [Lachnospiraceae bacterium]